MITIERAIQRLPVYIPGIEFSVTTETIAEINGTVTSVHSFTDAELCTLPYKPFNTFGFDVNKPTFVQVIWCCIDGTTTNGVTWKVTYDDDSLESGVLTTPATALDTVIVEDPEHETPYVMQKTAQGIINANTFVASDLVAFRVEADIVDSGNDPGCWFMGLLLTQKAD